MYANVFEFGIFLCPCHILDEVLKMITERGVDVASLDCTPFSDQMLVDIRYM